MKQLRLIQAPGRTVRHHRTHQPISSDRKRPTKVPAIQYYHRAVLAEDAIIVSSDRPRRPAPPTEE